MAEGRRRHRRVRPQGSWDSCDCPPGSRKIPNPKAPSYARKWLCIADLPKDGASSGGPRFVRARCNAADGRDYTKLVAERQAQKLGRRRFRPRHEREQLTIPGTSIPPREIEKRARQAQAQMEIPFPSRKKKRRAGPVDWAKCKCPTGSELFVNKRGVKQCRTRTSGGAWAFVKASCPGG